MIWLAWDYESLATKNTKMAINFYFTMINQLLL